MLNVSVQLFCLVLLHCLQNIKNLYLYCLCSKLDLDLVALLPESPASLAIVRRLIRRETFKNLSNLINYSLISSFKALPALNLGALDAGIGITSPV